MAVTTKPLVRVFKYEGTEYPDPTPGRPAEESLATLALSNAAFNNAALDGPFFKEGKQVFEIKVEEGTKG